MNPKKDPKRRLSKQNLPNPLSFRTRVYRSVQAAMVYATVWVFAGMWIVFEGYLLLHRWRNGLPSIGILRGTGDSMVPVIQPPGFVAYVPCTQYRVGDVIVFRSGEAYVVHRIINKTPHGVLTKGDGNQEADHDDHGIIPTEDIIGRACFVASYSGFGDPNVRV